ncbi:hypothetical protein [Fusibacter sp. JL216-2]|uniref:hypothetical protein n=1 Tax=Fusibacter sp. JL216-2 TaxID=3071453 RepID=UPI003D342768
MTRKRINSMMLCLIGVLALSGCGALSSEPASESNQVIEDSGGTMIADLIDLSDRLQFPEYEEASGLLFSDTGFIETMSKATDNYYLFNPVANERYAKSGMLSEWTTKEKDKLIKLTMEFENQFENYGIEFENGINLIKIASGSRLPMVFISEDNIILSQEAVDLHKDVLKEEMVQVYFKLYLGQNRAMLESLSAQLGFLPVEGVRLDESLVDHIVIRPGIYQPFKFTASRSDIDPSPEYTWVPISFINPETKLVEDYMLAVNITTNGEASIRTIKTTNPYLSQIGAMNKYMAMPLSKLKDVHINLGEIPDTYTHPEDILALNFMYLVLERPVTGTGTIEKLKTKLES